MTTCRHCAHRIEHDTLAGWVRRDTQRVDLIDHCDDSDTDGRHAPEAQA